MEHNTGLRIIDEDTDFADVGDVQIVNEMSLTGYSFDTLIKMAEQAPAIAKAMRQIQLASLSATNPQDWVDQSGKPYLQSSGSEKTAALWGISWQIIKQEKTIKDDSYIWLTTLRISAPRMGRVIDILGTRSSKDPFFGIRGGQAIPIDQIDEASVRKSSYTNALARGVQIILGLRNLTWEDLEKHGIEKGKVAKISRTSQTAPTEGDLEKKTELWNMLVEISGGDTKAANALLLQTSAFEGKDGTMVPGVPMTKLNGKRLDVNLGKIRDMYKIFMSDMQQDGGGDNDEEQPLPFRGFEDG